MARVDALALVTDSDCPSSDSVQAEVRELTTPEQRKALPADAEVRVSDRGQSITVTIMREGKTTVRVYRDPAGDCARRAHFVSVLVVVSLMPPDLGSDPEPAPETPPPAAPRPVAPLAREPELVPLPIRAPRRVRIELGLRADVSAPISDSVRVAAPSGALAVALGAGDARLTLGIGYAPGSLVRYTGSAAGSAELERLEVALGGRLALGHAPVDMSLDASLLLSRTQLTGRSSRRPTQDSDLDAGARVGLHVCASEQRRISPFVGAYATVFPFAPALWQLPQGSVGHLPYLWLGLSGGLALAL